MTPATAITAARALIERCGLYRDGYEQVTGELDPAGALGIVLFGEKHAGVWSLPPEWVLESPDWETGGAALRALVNGIGRWSPNDVAAMDAEALANHIAFWLTDPGAPTDTQVLELMARVAASLTTTHRIEIGAAA